MKPSRDGSADGLRAFGVFGHDDGAFNADKSPQSDQHGAFDLAAETAERFGVFAPEVKVETVKMKNERDDDDKQNQRHDFGDGADGVDQRCLFDAAQYQEIEAPDQN